MEWASEERGAADLGDERLNKRLVILLNTLGNQAQLSLPAACGGWPETKAAYRFFDNKQVKAEKLLTPHRSASVARLKQHKTVLLLQDTTPLNFSGQHQRADIGRLNHEKHRGILLHPSLAVTPERLCLGVIDTYHWSGEDLHHWESMGEKNRENHKIPFKDKESYKWLLSYEKAQAIATLAPDTRIITVAEKVRPPVGAGYQPGKEITIYTHYNDISEASIQRWINFCNELEWSLIQGRAVANEVTQALPTWEELNPQGDAALAATIGSARQEDVRITGSQYLSYRNDAKKNQFLPGERIDKKSIYSETFNVTNAQSIFMLLQVNNNAPQNWQMIDPLEWDPANQQPIGVSILQIPNEQAVNPAQNAQRRTLICC